MKRIDGPQGGATLCVVCQAAIPAGSGRFRREEGDLHVECNARSVRASQPAPAPGARQPYPAQ